MSTYGHSELHALFSVYALVIGYFYDLPVFEYKVCNFIPIEGALCKLPSMLCDPSPFTHTATATPWYLMPYMWFVYVLIVWAICVVLLVLLYCYKKKRAEADLAPVDSWLGN